MKFRDELLREVKAVIRNRQTALVAPYVSITTVRAARFCDVSVAQNGAEQQLE